MKVINNFKQRVTPNNTITLTLIVNILVNILTIIILLLFLSINAYGYTPSEKEITETEKALSNLKVNIKSLEHNLEKIFKQSNSLEFELQDIDKDILSLNNQTLLLEQQLSEIEDSIMLLSISQEESKSSMANQLEHIRHQTQQLWQLSQSPDIKFLLDHQLNVAETQRAWVYLDYLNKHYQQTFATLQEQFNAHVQLNQQWLKEKDQALVLQQQIDNEQQKLQAQKQQKQHLLTVIFNNQTHDSNQLAQLKLEEESLEQALIELQQLLADLNDINKIETPPDFQALKGQLPYPIVGPRGRHSKHQNGIFISSPSGTVVKSVAAGRVAFADWLRGFGLLTIVDHGDGFMTLYAHNQSVFKEIGDWIKQGESIAQVGNTGTTQESGLYFEIRHHGRAIATKPWLN